MENAKDLIPIIELILIKYGTIGLIIIALLTLITYILIKKLISDIEENSKKKLINFQNQLEGNMKFLFRNESIRNEVVSHLAIKSIETKIEIWKETYDLYFTFLKYQTYDIIQLKNEISDFDIFLNKNRNNIFLNSIYIGGDLTSCYIAINSSMRTIIRNFYGLKKIESNNIINSFEMNNIRHYQNENAYYFDRIEKSISKVDLWFKENSIADHNVRSWEINDNQFEEIIDEKKRDFKPIQ